jgi:general stress protein 26
MDQEIIEKAGEIIRAKTGYIGGGMEGYATIALIDENGYPTASTKTIAKADGIKWITFNTSLSTNSVKRINKCNRASVCINSSEYNITLVGTVEILTDPKTKEDMWFSGMEGQWSGIDDPEYCVLKFTTEEYSLFVDYKQINGKI